MPTMRELIEAVRRPATVEITESMLTELEVGGGIDTSYQDEIAGQDFEHPQIDMFPELPPVDIRVPDGYKQVGRMGAFHVVEKLYSDEYHVDPAPDLYFIDRGKPVAWVGLKTPEQKWLVREISDSGATGYQVGGVHVTDAYRGQRLSLKIYRWVLQNVCDFLMADTLQTSDGVQLWKMLQSSKLFDVMVYDRRTGMSRQRWRGKDFNNVYNDYGNLYPWVTLRGKAGHIMSGAED